MTSPTKISNKETDQIAKAIGAHEDFLKRKNEPVSTNNGIFQRYEYPVVTAEHTPLMWRYDFDPQSPMFMKERQGVNAAFNPGAIFFNGKFCLVVRVEGYDRKSFFAVAESDNGIDNFRFWDHPISMPQTDEPDTNIYDMRLTPHEDGWIYGLFCTERRPNGAPDTDQSVAEAKCGIARTKDLVKWERLPDLDSGANQQRNVVLHPEFVDGKYALYTRPQDGFIDAGKGGGIGWSLVESMEKAKVGSEKVIDPKVYHTIKEVKNGQGPPPIKTGDGWLHLAHGVRNTAAGLRYVLYMFMTSLDDPSKVIHRPGGHFMGPQDDERVGDVSNVLFANGWIAKEDGKVFIYYASSDTRCHVATSSIEQLVTYCKYTPEDGLLSASSVQVRDQLINNNLAVLEAAGLK